MCIICVSVCQSQEMENESYCFTFKHTHTKINRMHDRFSGNGPEFVGPLSYSLKWVNALKLIDTCVPYICYRYWKAECNEPNKKPPTFLIFVYWFVSQSWISLSHLRNNQLWGYTQTTVRHMSMSIFRLCIWNISSKNS